MSIVQSNVPVLHAVPLEPCSGLKEPLYQPTDPVSPAPLIMFTHTGAAAVLTPSGVT